jgi:hypothetical protein
MPVNVRNSDDLHDVTYESDPRQSNAFALISLLDDLSAAMAIPRVPESLR